VLGLVHRLCIRYGQREPVLPVYSGTGIGTFTVKLVSRETYVVIKSCR